MSSPSSVVTLRHVVRRAPWLVLVSVGAIAVAITALGRSEAAPPAAEPAPGRFPNGDAIAKRLAPKSLLPHQTAWTHAGVGAIRGITVGPIESSLHPGKGYGSEYCGRTLRDARRMGATWISLTPFGRIWDLAPTGVDPSFEAPFELNRAAVGRAVSQAHAQGLQVLLVPHLWVETGGWRGELDLKSPSGWLAWAEAYERFIVAWARLAEETHVDLFSVGVELRHWVTTTRAPTFTRVIEAVRGVYGGLITYAGNWDDIETTVILGDIDVIGVNAFYPLADADGASLETLLAGGRQVAERAGQLAAHWGKPVVFTEVGYTTRSNPAVRPWEWPDHMNAVRVNQRDQATAYFALLAPMIDQAWFAGFFVWRVYADPDDLSQEAEWGFSPRGKLAELVVRDAFAAHFAADGPRPLGASLWRHRATRIGRY